MMTVVIIRIILLLMFNIIPVLSFGILPPSPLSSSSSSSSSLLFGEYQFQQQTRRDVMKNAIISILPLIPITTTTIATPKVCNAADTVEKTQKDEQVDENERPFTSAAFPKKEYTNSIVASRDTNVSPLEVYETLATKLRRKNNNDNNDNARALDVGAGAGVSTQVLYRELGYHNIDAVDWSADAWEENVVMNGYCPPTVHFYALDDERFVEEIWKKQQQQQQQSSSSTTTTTTLPLKYDIIAFNFAVNRDKALYFCRNLLKQPDGLLLAPINTQRDYWLKQTYQLLDAQGNIVWSANDVGAWSVQFQPDVTSDTCQGVWCPPFNGFQKLQKKW